MAMNVITIGCALLPEVKQKVNLMGLHPFNVKSMTISFIGTPIIPVMHTSSHNALRI